MSYYKYMRTYDNKKDINGLSVCVNLKYPGQLFMRSAYMYGSMNELRRKLANTNRVYVCTVCEYIIHV